MAIIEGQIESLKRLKTELKQKRISRFTSVDDIRKFQNNFESEKNEIVKQIEKTVSHELNEFHEKYLKQNNHYNDIKAQFDQRIYKMIGRGQTKYSQIKSKRAKNLIIKIFYFVLLALLKIWKSFLENNVENIVHLRTTFIKWNVVKTKREFDKHLANREIIVSKRCKPKISELEFTYNTVESLNPLIAGAIGENLVVNELKKLSDKYILFNDFSMKFKTPIINKKENDRIFSVQIDHLLVTNSGLFILETKNWSKESIQNIDLRSPVEQIRRTSYAMYVLLNGNFRKSIIGLIRHPWGRKNIPIRNIVVMINNKPKEQFRYVKVKLLRELNNYITYFEPIFEDSEVINISNYLRNLKNK